MSRPVLIKAFDIPVLFETLSSLHSVIYGAETWSLTQPVIMSLYPELLGRPASLMRRFASTLSNHYLPASSVLDALNSVATFYKPVHQRIVTEPSRFVWIHCQMDGTVFWMPSLHMAPVSWVASCLSRHGTGSGLLSSLEWTSAVVLL